MSVTSSATSSIANTNIAASGVPTISGTTTQGQTLTANIGGVSDGDGINAGTNAYQWIRDGSDISGATSSTYTLVQADVGTAITVRYSFSDNESNANSTTSSATSSIANANVAASGVPTISGTTTQGQTLTANISGVSDGDGNSKAILAIWVLH